MATYQAIATVGEAILGMMKAARPSEFETAQFSLYQPSDFQNPMTEGLSLYLYHVSLNTTRRNLPPRVQADGRRFRPSLPVDLHYLLIPWAQTSAKQQWLLGWAMRALEDMPILSATLLNHYGSVEKVFHPDETVEIVNEPLLLQEVVNIWDAFKPNLQVSASYIARMVLIDSETELIEAPIVQTRGTRYEKERP